MVQWMYHVILLIMTKIFKGNCVNCEAHLTETLHHGTGEMSLNLCAFKIIGVFTSISRSL